ncbi:hypothetical protein GW891_05745 [bacterium]|nr:hypothetical protein [bacterium]
MKSNEITIVVQINGKLRDQITVNSTATNDDIFTKAIKLEKVKKYIEGKKIIRQIIVPNKLINLVTK